MREVKLVECSVIDDFWSILVPIEKKFLWWKWYEWGELQTMSDLPDVKKHCEKYDLKVMKIVGRSLYKYRDLVTGNEHGNYVFA